MTDKPDNDNIWEMRTGKNSSKMIRQYVRIFGYDEGKIM